MLEKNRGYNPSIQKFCKRDCLFIKNILALVLLKKYYYFSRYGISLGLVFIPLNRFSADQNKYVSHFLNPP